MQDIAALLAGKKANMILSGYSRASEDIGGRHARFC